MTNKTEMTAAIIKKVDETPYDECCQNETREFIMEALKSAEECGYRRAVNDAKELTTDHNGCVNSECFKRNCAVVLFDQIESLTPEKP